MTEVRASEARTRQLTVKPELQERCELQEKRCYAQLREPSAQPAPRLLPKMAPKPCSALAAEEQNKEMKAEEEDEGRAGPVGGGSTQRVG